MAWQSRGILDRLRRRAAAQTKGQEYKYVNVAGGRREGPEIYQARKYLEKAGFGRFLDDICWMVSSSRPTNSSATMTLYFCRSCSAKA